ncbi:MULTISPECIES: DUF397 domain-containing protein [unclassified Streptomyces]|uniref:DUF397 domain-containing protein n=1 Tax=unclassified Streptomyces TaxID=2593676 RepID=UPI00081E85DA|nr:MULTISPECIES: DUF397 domain-containing protein [unclassified Streptomyces]MYR97066.1 DUF397 domain-containing protein [Streptomyces sp. SID4937]SCE20342.1 protein of unknown function [Streptomyces sp. ScaeMP-e83]
MIIDVSERASALVWVTSSYSNGQGGECIEWAPEHAATTGEYLVRDSKNPTGPRLSLTAEGFAGLVAFAKASA